MEKYNFAFPQGETISFEGEYLGGLKKFLGRLDMAVYQTEDTYVVVLSRSLEPQRWFEYHTSEELIEFMLGSIAQVGYELTGVKTDTLGERELQEFLKQL
ncbi:MAG: hypothetical protein ACNI27_10030 [Desulfovibrio sp.]